MWTLLAGCALTTTTIGAVLAHFLSYGYVSYRLSSVPIHRVLILATPSHACAICWASVLILFRPDPTSPYTVSEVSIFAAWAVAVLSGWARYAWGQFWRPYARRSYAYQLNEWGIPRIGANDFAGPPVQMPRQVRIPDIVEGARPADPTTCVVCLDRPAACTGHPCGHAVLCERCMWDWREHSPGAGCVYCTQPLDRIEIPAD